ncbi:VOC family protein [Flaviaesturariibacter terrae]
MQQHFSRRWKQPALLALLVASSFCLGFAVKAVTAPKSPDPALKRVTGIGGIFFKCKDPKKVRAWYQEHLGLNTNQYGAVFEWRQGADTTKKGFTQWSPFNEKTTYFEPSGKDFMINYRVADLDRLVAALRSEGVTITDTIQAYDYGKFVHILDVEGNKIELWEPNDAVYEKMGVQMGAKTTK